jgi:hypothetical protein
MGISKEMAIETKVKQTKMHRIFVVVVSAA